MLIESLVNLNTNGHYIHWGFVQISLANFLVIVAMIVVFILALVIPFPSHEILRDDHNKEFDDTGSVSNEPSK